MEFIRGNVGEMYCGLAAYESLVSDIGRACMMDVGYKTGIYARCNHVCEKLVWELLNLLLRRNINKEAMAMLE